MSLQPPHLELNFYFADDSKLGFSRLFKALIELGAIPKMPKSLDTEQLQSINVAKFDNASGLRQRDELLQYGRITKQSELIDHPSLQIVTSGTVFDPIPSLEKQAKQSARKIYRRFVAIIQAVQPAYAAITFENWLPCPSDFKHDPVTNVFSDFYVATDYIGHDQIRTIRELYHKAYIADLAHGIYLSSWRFNPKGKKPDKDWRPSKEQIQVAKMIASVGMQ